MRYELVGAARLIVVDTTVPGVVQVEIRYRSGETTRVHFAPLVAERVGHALLEGARVVRADSRSDAAATAPGAPRPGVVHRATEADHGA